MRSDGQLYRKQECIPPPLMECDVPPCEPLTQCNKKGGIDPGQLVIIGLIFLLVTDKCKTDVPLILALLYVLL